MTPDIAERLALVFPTAALQKPGVTGVTNVADVTGYAQKPQELRQLRLLRQENDNAGKMPDEGVVADVASPIATDSGAIEEWAALATEERAAVSAAQAREAARAAGVRLEAHGEDLILEADVAPTTDVADAQTRKKSCVPYLLRAGRDSWSGDDWRAFFDERATLAEFDGGLPREQAEASAFACCVTEWLNRNRKRSPPDRCLRCGGAEHAHAPLLPFGTESTGHAWLHSHCWSAWSAARHAEAVAALEAMGIATPAGFPNDFDKNGGA